MEQKLTVVCISDTHNCHQGLKLPEGDILIHSGDFCQRGTFQEAFKFLNWFGELNFKYKIFTAGNHDVVFDWRSLRSQDLENYNFLKVQVSELKKKNCYFLENDLIEIEGYRIWGSPYSLRFYDWVFQLEESESERFWDEKILNNIDILITHGPPYGHGDISADIYYSGQHVGDKGLMKKVEKVKPKYHIFGHIHEGYGRTANQYTEFINCSMLDKNYYLNKPIVFTIPKLKN